MEVRENNLESELASKTIKLHWLLQITKAINYNLPAEQLFRIYKTVLEDHLKVGKLMLFINEDKWQHILSYGADFTQCEIDFDNDFENLNDIHQNNVKKPQWISQFETIIPVFHNEKSLAYALIGDFSKMEGNQKRIVPFIHTITNLIVVAIENKRLTKESIRQASLEKEMELAAEMQSMLFPENLDGHNVFDVAATYLPHQEVGGDYYDYFKINENESIVCMADVSGKGIAAALLMSNFQAHLHAVSRHIDSLSELIKSLNTTVFKNAKGEKYITVFLAKINHHTKNIQYVNAGHNPPLLFHNDQFELLENGTIGLGMFEELPFIKEGSAHFPKCAMLFCYTDGVTELEDMHGNPYGLEKIKKIIAGCSFEQTLESFHECVMVALNDFRKETAFNDDVTLLTLRSV
ncbi:MAG TPA: SpoIIE family protein phosphatase [Bacteroidia bacterium]|nr:SpoIIE family protein phosphatase [Bacteroidia bacterium]